jgi:hypothetical protein
LRLSNINADTNLNETPCFTYQKKPFMRGF